MVHEVDRGLHFSEAAADAAFVTKNAYALRDAYSKESLTAPFKSIQTPPTTEKPSKESRPTSKHQNGTHNSNTRGPKNNSNIFSFNSKKEAASEPYDDNSNFEKVSTAGFDFNRHRSYANGVGPLTKPTPSKWDDAEKWLSAGESAPTKARPKNSPLGATATATISACKDEARPNPEVDPDGVDREASDGENHTGFDVEEMSPEKMNKFMVDCTKKVEAGSKKSLLPRFAFMPSAKPLPLPQSVASVHYYPLDDAFGRDDSNARDHSSMHGEAAHEPFSIRTAKPTAAGITVGAIAAAKPVDNRDDESKTHLDALMVYASEESGMVNMRTVCMRDMGTEMTPTASMDPSCTATPLMATTPNLGSPVISRPSSPGWVRTTTPTSTESEKNKLDLAAAVAASKVKSSGLSRKEKTRAEILVLGTQLGKANIAAWATKEEEEADAAQALKACLEMEEVRKNFLASRAAAWEEAEQAKYNARFKREEAKIQAWENHEKAKAEAEMRRVEVNVERMRSHANEKLMNKLAAARRRAEDLRAKAEAARYEQANKTSTRSDHIRRTGNIPTSFFSHLCG